MAITWLQYEGFDHIANQYANTKPLVSKCHTREEDIRPIADRNRKYERIKKINDNCYILQDGYHSGDEVFGNYYGAKQGTPTEAEIIKLAPIVWRKPRDGSETITIRNGTGYQAHNSRYSFLDRCLPLGLQFIIRNGKHFILCHNDGVEYYLAKSLTMAEHAMPKKDRGVQNPRGYTTRDDGVSLTFKRITKYQRCFEFISGGKPIPKPPRKIVDKEAKAKMKDAISTFRNWSSIMFPMLPKDDREYRSRLMQELSEQTNGAFSPYMWNVIDSFGDKFELSRDIISDENHPLRLHLAYFLFSSIEDRYAEDMDAVASRAYVMSVFNRRINRVCNFTKTVKG
tara:strand:- start:130 stop:1152 length:1023 start_codon:yes stop_codon:yes gene_type:complete